MSYCVDFGLDSNPEDPPSVDNYSLSAEDLPSGIAASPPRVARSLYVDPVKGL